MRWGNTVASCLLRLESEWKVGWKGGRVDSLCVSEARKEFVLCGGRGGSRLGLRTEQYIESLVM